MAKQHKTACPECPWRKDSKPGWLGAATPVQFLATAYSDQRMPCHCTVDYESPDWEEQAKKAPQCAGRAEFFSNMCKEPRNPKLLTVNKVNPMVFGRPTAFLEHHTLNNERVPDIVVVMDHVIEVKAGETVGQAMDRYQRELENDQAD